MSLAYAKRVKYQYLKITKVISRTMPTRLDKRIGEKEGLKKHNLTFEVATNKSGEYRRANREVSSIETGSERRGAKKVTPTS